MIKGIYKTEIDRPPRETIDAFMKIDDLTATVSDILDALGIASVVSATILKPNFEGAKVVGPAITLKNIPQVSAPTIGATEWKSKMATYDLYNIAKTGDVAVFDGRGCDVSMLGGNSATAAKRQGVIGAIVDGGVRDVESQLRIRFPIWYRHITPITGKWRLETVAINSPVTIANVHLSPGDLVIADGTGVCFVPSARIGEVLERAKKLDANDSERREKLEKGVPLPEIFKLKFN